MNDIACAECGIRYSPDLDACPWCNAPRPADLGPAPPSPGEDAGRDAPPGPPAAAAAGAAADAAITNETPTWEARIDEMPPPRDGTAILPPPDAISTGERAAAALGEGGGAASVPARARWKTWLINGLAVVALLALGAVVAEYAPLGRGESTGVTFPPDTSPVIPEDTTTIPPTTVTTVPAEETTTTTATTTTTTTTTTTLPPIEAVGDPIPVGDLSMAADAIGPLLFGSDGIEVVGRLVSSLGQPDEDSGVYTSGGEMGTCAGDEVRVVRFGSLAAANVVDDEGNQVFAGYRVDLGFQDEPSPADDMRTLSGLQAGDTVADLEEIYASFDVELIEEDAGARFELRSGGGDLLLWGPISSTGDDGTIEGIYSPDPCA